ncbi:MAG: glycoside hydrolase family 127 protein [Acidobacteria bacterium]|nr:glycoside hydrolase family 127 protein [Acidobacteriota bacterium]
MKPIIALLIPAALGLAASAPVVNRAPLAPNAMYSLPLGSVKPSGWLRKQLQIQADGLSGKLDEFWPSVGPDSGWLGGTGESWERGPYYMDGLVPLAFLLDDPVLIAKAHKWVRWTLENQRADGGIGPAKNADWWPNMVMLKVLTQYQEATGDARVVPLMLKYAKYQLASMKAVPLKEWAIYRWADEVVALLWLYNRTGDADVIELARLLHEQGYDWKGHYANFQYPGKVAKKDAVLKTHVVNNAMALKTPGVWSVISGERGDREAIRQIYDVMDRYHGMPTGIHGGDEHYAGRSPVQGTELCAVVEAMFSIENVTAILGDAALGDRLEKIAYNALPGTFSADMWAHQYDQQPNQVLVNVDRRSWTTNGPQSNLYGLEPNFGCCTANFHQGWPKFAASLWMAMSEGGLAAVAYSPSEVDTTVKGVRVRVSERTEYPFDEAISIAVQPDKAIAFPLLLRVPEWAGQASIRVNGKAERDVRAGSFHRIERLWKAGDRVELRFPMQVRVVDGYNGGAVVERGPLVYSLKVGEDWRKIAEHGPAADWEVRPASAWNYALAADAKAFEFVSKPMGKHPFSPDGAPVALIGKGRKLAGWGMENGSAAPPPSSPAESAAPLERLTLIPYGAAKLRITVFPRLKE